MAMKCIEISIETDNEAAEAVSALFNEYSQGGAIIEELWNGTAEPSIIRVKTFLSPQHSATLPRIEEALWHLGQIYPIPSPSVRWLSEADWMDKWKAGYELQRIGHRIVIRPSWQPYTAAQDEIVIQLDPGMAFGTGLHPSTRLCLAALEDYVQPGVRVLDVGTGSGILGIAAAKLGAASVVALDVDPVALEVARENVVGNNVEETVSLERASMHSLSSYGRLDDPAGHDVQIFNALGNWNGTFDLLLMNILAKIIAQSAKAIAACLTAKGSFVVSGIIQPQEDEVRQALTAAGLKTEERRVHADWIALIGGKESRQSDHG